MIVLGVILNYILGALYWAVLIRALISFLPLAGVQINPYNPIVKILYDITDPILVPLRRFTTVGMIDLSPLVALIVINFIQRIIASSFL